MRTLEEEHRQLMALHTQLAYFQQLLDTGAIEKSGRASELDADALFDENVRLLRELTAQIQAHDPFFEYNI